MGAVAPFIPMIGSALGGIFAGKKATQAAQTRSPEESAALTGATNAGNTLMGMGQNLTGTGLPYIQNAGNYYQTLLGGNRAQMALATAGPRAALSDQARGQELSLERSGVRGAVRDVAKAGISRDTAGQIAGLTTGVQPGAAQALGSLGTQTTGLGVNAAYSGGSIYDRLLGQGFQNRQYARGEGEKTGSSIGGLLFDILRGTVGKGGGGGNGSIGGGWSLGDLPWIGG